MKEKPTNGLIVHLISIDCISISKLCTYLAPLVNVTSDKPQKIAIAVHKPMMII